MPRKIEIGFDRYLKRAWMDYCFNLMASGTDLTQEYSMSDAGTAWITGDFDLFPAGAGQISALINEIKSVKDIIEGMVS